jgi:DNA-directed RNA polymerase sigma subunit (sigma70/sigma32)
MQIINRFNVDRTFYTERANECLRLYLIGKTLEQIGDVYEVTRYRILQILKQYHPDYKTKKKQSKLIGELK